MSSIVGWLASRGMISPTMRNYLREVRYGLSRPEWWIKYDQERHFFRQFVPRGGLVYDVGANAGDLTHVFRMLGARVIAFEPQADVFAQLAQRFAGDDQVVPVNVALGRTPGRATIYLGSDHSTTSLSADYVHQVAIRGALGDATWVPDRQVEVRTLDEVASEYGAPDFLKIDVEGFEAEVLAGLHVPVPALSIEITAEHIAPAIECIDHLSRLGAYEYNWSGLWSHTLQHRRWLSSREARELVWTWPQRQAHYPRKADVYARIEKTPSAA